jgi:hypothetical protein
MRNDKLPFDTFRQRLAPSVKPQQDRSTTGGLPYLIRQLSRGLPGQYVLGRRDAAGILGAGFPCAGTHRLFRQGAIHYRPVAIT